MPTVEKQIDAAYTLFKSLEHIARVKRGAMSVERSIEYIKESKDIPKIKKALKTLLEK